MEQVKIQLDTQWKADELVRTLGCVCCSRSGSVLSGSNCDIITVINSPCCCWCVNKLLTLSTDLTRQLNPLRPLCQHMSAPQSSTDPQYSSTTLIKTIITNWHVVTWTVLSDPSPELRRFKRNEASLFHKESSELCHFPTWQYKHEIFSCDYWFNLY